MQQYCNSTFRICTEQWLIGEKRGEPSQEKNGQMNEEQYFGGNKERFSREYIYKTCIICFVVIKRRTGVRRN